MSAITINIDQVSTHDSLLKTGDRCTTQLAKMSIDELTADVVINRIYL